MKSIGNIYHKLPRPIRRHVRAAKQFILIAFRIERRFVRLMDFLKQNPNKAEFVYHEDSQLFYATPRYEKQVDSVLCNGSCLHGGVLRFKSACCFAKSDIIQLSDGNLWYELRDLYQDIHKDCNCSDGIVLLNDEKKWYETIQFSRIEYLEKGFFLSGIFSSNYYHFVLAILPRIRWIQSVPADVPLLVDRSAEKYDSYKQLLDFCNTEKRPLVFLDNEIKYQVDELYCATTQMMAQPNYRTGQVLANDDDQYNEHSMDFVRNIVLRHITNSNSLRKRVFISRKNASGLRKFNEEECIESLKPLGFEVVYPEDLSLLEQASLFNQAECIVGGSGAAFTNILFASDKTKIIILEGYRTGICIFSSIAKYAKANLIYLYDKSLGIIPNGDYIHSDFHIDTQELRKLVCEITTNY